jgi:hypothetical protein
MWTDSIGTVDSTVIGILVHPGLDQHGHLQAPRGGSCMSLTHADSTYTQYLEY